MNPGCRAEELPPATVVRLANALVGKGAAVPPQPTFSTPEEEPDEDSES